MVLRYMTLTTKPIFETGLLGTKSHNLLNSV